MADVKHPEANRGVLGRGHGVAALFNGRAKQVTPAVVRAFRKALPEAMVLVSEDLEQSHRHAERIAHARPLLVFSGGGDGAAVRLLNLLRAELPEDVPFPTLAVIRLGTGNAWSRAVGAKPYHKMLQTLPHLKWPLPTLRFDLVEVEGQLCPFSGVGWDARILNDYQRNLDKRSSQLFGSRFATRLHKGLGGYLYSVARYTVPEELSLQRSSGPALVRVERVEGDAFTLDARGEPVKVDEDLLYDGRISVGGAATIPEYGFGLRAYPNAMKMPGYINVRIYDRPVTEALPSIPKLWAGAPGTPGMHDFFVKKARMTFPRPMPFQIGGDPHGERSTVEFQVGGRAVNVVHWAAAG